MDVKINKLSETKRELEITMTPEEMEPHLSKVTKEFSENMNIKGFRPGNAPREMVENTMGKKELWEEAAKEAIKQDYPKIIQENNLFTVAQPKVEIVSLVPDGEVKYKAEVYVMPEFELPDYKSIAEDTVKNEKTTVETEKKEIDDTLEKIRESRAKVNKVSREAREGDKVTLNFTGSFEGEEEKKIDEKDFQVTLGKGELDVFKGFEENILGMKEGDKKEFSIEIPVSGENKSVNFEAEMVSVMEREVPDADDEFASTIPDVENIEQLKEKIKEGIEADKKAKESERLKMKVMEEIKKKVEFEVPEVLIDKEIENMLENMKHQVSQSGMSFEEYLKSTNKTEDDLRSEWREKAKENVSYAIILHKISEKEDIEVTDEEIEKEVDRHFAASGRVKEEENEENLERMRAHIHDIMKNRKVFEVLSVE